MIILSDDDFVIKSKYLQSQLLVLFYLYFQSQDVYSSEFVSFYIFLLQLYVRFFTPSIKNTIVEPIMFSVM